MEDKYEKKIHNTRNIAKSKLTLVAIVMCVFADIIFAENSTHSSHVLTWWG